ncbi:MAG: T9SS type A sorting domain-containing protein [Bacteroidetes bacterium]|nr:T9SS type A sorting domain-containing protein [Bacteroidota bacterium]
MGIFYLNARMKKPGLSFILMPVLFALPHTSFSQVAVQNPICYGDAIQLMCNFTEGCSNPGATFTWHNSSGSWTTNVRDPVLSPPGFFIIGDGQTANPYGFCNGEGYGTDWFYLTVHFSPPPGGVRSGSVHVMANQNINISGTVKNFDGSLMNGGTACMFNTGYGVFDTVAMVPVSNGQFTFSNTCGMDGSPVLVIPNNTYMVPTYLGNAATWSEATPVVASSSLNVGEIHMIKKPVPVMAGGNVSLIKGHVYQAGIAKANDPIDNVGVIIRKTSNPSLLGYGISDEAGSFDLGTFEPGDYSISSDYPGIPMYTQNGANNIRTYNPLDTIILTMHVVSNPVMTDSNFVRVFPSYVVSPACSVQEEIVYAGVTRCYNALQSLTVGGVNGQEVVVYSGGDACYVAGQKINFKPGFSARSGASVWGHITTTGQFCSQLFGSNNSLDGMTVPGGENRCFQAMGTLSVGGTATPFLAESGSSVHLVAGQKVIMYPGTHAAPGAYLHAYISTDGTYCNEPKAVTAENDGNGETGSGRSPFTGQDTFFKVYPNPTSGSVTLELSSEPGGSAVSVCCYDNMGSLVMEEAYHAGKKHELSLAGRAPGIYLLRVMTDGRAGLKKIIKQQ